MERGEEVRPKYIKFGGENRLISISYIPKSDWTDIMSDLAGTNLKVQCKGEINNNVQ